jgi:PAS domain S-box-containing protein
LILKIVTHQKRRTPPVVLPIQKHHQMGTLLPEQLMENSSFAAMFAHASVGIILTNANAAIIMANNHVLRMFGYADESQLKGFAIEKLIPARYHQTHVEQRQQFATCPMSRPMGLGMDLLGVRKNGVEFPVEVSLAHYRTGNELFLLAFVNDITKRKAAEFQLIAQKQELELLNQKIAGFNDQLEDEVQNRTSQLRETLNQLKLSQQELSDALSKEKELSDLKTRFVSMASHEFRTPLTTILSSASLVAKYRTETEHEKREKHIGRIKEAVHNLTDILNEFLSIGKIEDGKIAVNPAWFDVQEHLGKICQEMQGITKPGQTIGYLHGGNTQLLLDKVLLRNILVNLLSNAIKFSSADAPIQVESNVGAQQFTLTVADKGIGISPQDQQHLFERFFRGKNAVNVQGTGLGLHIVGKYAELMGGQIYINSQIETGTTITVTFLL